MQTRGHTIVVGGGIIGCAIAYYLSTEGVKVTVLERSRLGYGASHAAAGMLAPLAEVHGPGPFLDLSLKSLAMYREVARLLEEEAGVDIEYTESGILRVAADETGASQLKGSLKWQGGLEMGTCWLEPEDVLRMEPALSKDVQGGVLSPKEGHVNSLRVVEGFAQAAARRGAEWHTGVSITAFLTRSSRVTGVVAGGREFHGDHVVLAAGAWSGTIGSLLGLDLPVRPVRGQAISLHWGPSSPRRVVFGPRAYLVPQKDGTLLVGATQEEVGFDDRVTAEGLQGILARSIALLPGLKDATFLAAWSGLRPGSPDGHPIIGPVKGWDGLVLATGHFRNGILLAPATGQLVRDYIVDGIDAPLKPLGLFRFAPARTK